MVELFISHYLLLRLYVDMLITTISTMATGYLLSINTYLQHIVIIFHIFPMTWH